MQWQEPTFDTEPVWEIVKECGVSPLLAGLLVRRGWADARQARGFIEPKLADLADPFAIRHMDAAVDRVQQAVARNESVLIFGDYDVDGVTSTASLVSFLRDFGLSPKYVVPRRLTEGYGLSVESLERALSQHVPHLLIAVDCGTSSAAEVAWLRARGIDVLILDHHTSKEALPQDCVVVNPHVFDPVDSSWVDLCSVGLVFKLCHAFLKRLRAEGDVKALEMDLREHLDLVALGTVADLVPLLGENRILVSFGLQRLRNCRRPGLCALMEMAGLRIGEAVDTFDIGFRIGPRINAGGRLEEATVPIELLLSPDREHGMQIAVTLNELNTERKQIENDIAAEADRMVLDAYAEEAGLVVCRPQWHTGVVGITASRIARKYNRPTIVLGMDGDGALKGSGRSVAGVDLVAVLQQCSVHLSHWGGHPMAIGLTLAEDALEAFRKDFSAAVKRLYPAGVPDKVLEIDAVAKPREFTHELLGQLDRMAPFGQGNPEPLFAVHRARISQLQPMGSNGHWRFQLLTDERPLDVVAWGLGERTPPVDREIDLAVRFGWNIWRGQRSPRLTMVAWRPA
jgi:single-stranded-DNA-specific exonuclease